MKLVVALGNPDKKYENTRHNIGFDFLDAYLSWKNIDKKWIKKFDGLYFQEDICGDKVLFLKPQTYMNLSGISVQKIVHYFGIKIEDILVISDDLDLNLGNYKFKLAGSSGGHNGIKSIEENLKSSSFKRLKIGISKDVSKDTKDYVLGKFSVEEKEKLTSLFSKLFFALDDYFSLPFEKLMNKYNQKNR